jgi:hypothetical protein
MDAGRDASQRRWYAKTPFSGFQRKVTLVTFLSPD